MIENGLFGETNVAERAGKDELYQGNEHHPGVCPVCNSTIKKYGCYEIVDSDIRCLFSCENCGVAGYEWSNIVFDGYGIR